MPGPFYTITVNKKLSQRIWAAWTFTFGFRRWIRGDPTAGLDLEHYHHAGPEVPRWAVDQLRKLDFIIKNQETIMATLDDVLNYVTDEKTQIAGISTLIAGLKQQLADALAGTTLPPATQAKVDAIFAAAEQNKADIATALAANTPAAPSA